MLKSGLTSVTFRHLKPVQIAEYMNSAGIETIEWGSDIHAPCGDTENAEYIKKISDEHGIEISSYGSYYRLGENDNPQKEFEKYLSVARILCAPVIRIWTGVYDFEDADGEYYAKCVEEAKLICDMAKSYGIVIGAEYHNGTLTNNADNAVRFLKDIGKSNFKLYYQYNPREGCAENLISAEKMMPYICNIHIFNIDIYGKHYFFDENDAENFWLALCRKLVKRGCDTNLLFEFLKQADLAGLKKDAHIMKNIMERAEKCL